MEQQMLPLFPLQAVLFPRTPLPLHIFEERYKEMMNEVIRASVEFGVVQAGEKGIVNAGCSATVEKVLKRYPDGRLDLFTVGRRRFEILSLDEDRPFLRAAVRFFDDDDFDPIPEDLQRLAIESYRQLRTLSDVTVVAEPEMSDPQLSFQLGQSVPDLTFRQLMLVNRSEKDRLKSLVDYLPSYVARQRRIEHMRELAPRNGHGNLPVSL